MKEKKMFEMKSCSATRETENMFCSETFSFNFTLSKLTILPSFEFRSFKLVKLAWLTILVDHRSLGWVSGGSVKSPDLHISEIVWHGNSLRGLADDQACLGKDFFQLLGGPDELALRLVEFLIIIPDIVEEDDERASWTLSGRSEQGGHQPLLCLLEEGRQLE